MASHSRFCSESGLDVHIRGTDQCVQTFLVGERRWSHLDVTHESAVSRQQVGRVVKGSPVEEADVDVGREYVDVTKRGISHTRGRVTVVQEFGDVVATAAHDLEPLFRNDREIGPARLEPPVDLGQASDRTVESEEAGHGSGLRFER